jgi:uncharacterized phiE125 gp8 family phage protein
MKILSNPRPSSSVTPLVTWAQMQAQLRLDTADEQQLISDYVDACIEYAEQALYSSLLTRTIVVQDAAPISLVFWAACQPKARYELPRGPVQSITSMVDANGQVIPPANMILDGYGFLDILNVNYSSYVAPVTITYVAGYGPAAANVPADICMAIRTHVAGLWRNRESISDRTLLPVPHGLQDFYRLKARTTPAA